MLNQAVLSGRYVQGTIIWQVYEGPSHFIGFKLKPEKIIFYLSNSASVNKHHDIGMGSSESMQQRCSLSWEGSISNIACTCQFSK